MRKLLKDRIGNSRGQAMTEFVLVLPLLLLIVYAALSFGLMIYTKSLLVLSASHASRTASYVLLDDEISDEDKVTMIKKSAYNIMTNGIDGTDRNVVIIPDEANGQVSVKVEYNFKYILPLLGDIFTKDKYMLEYTSTSALQ